MNKTTNRLLVALSAALPILWAAEAAAYPLYNGPNDNDGCQVCHGHFWSNVSPQGNTFLADDKHEMHRTEMGASCNLCHPSGQKGNPPLGASKGTSNNAGVGCCGCHGREQDMGNDGGFSPGRGAGLRQHHTNAGVNACVGCHQDADPANYTPVDEDVLPLYYGVTADSLANNPLNLVAQFQLNENWTNDSDFVGLDNDGDLLYDAAETGNQAPVADPGGPYTGDVNVAVVFDGTASTDDSAIVTYDWDYGDGSPLDTDAGPTPSHTYTSAGNFTVQLTVTDDASPTPATHTASTSAAIGGPPIADPGGPYTGDVDVAVVFDGTASSDPGGTINTYDWDYGDGSPLDTNAGATPSHTYTSAGIYTVTLTVTDNDSLTDVATVDANIGGVATPAPPVPQTIGKDDETAGVLVETDCRACHTTPPPPERHHNLYGLTIPGGSIVPYPDADGDGSDDTNYGCLNCHADGGGGDFLIERDCVVCHSSTAHHTTAAATSGLCTPCHGDIVDDMTDGHYVPSYSPSLVTPYRSGGPADQTNLRDNGAGACDYCHDDDGLPTPVIETNRNLHHGAGLDSGNCLWCHDTGTGPSGADDGWQMRTCEGCHGPVSLHNIQADSPNTGNLGTLVVGGEDYGYGHVGRDAGPGDSDCWGCHGFAGVSGSFGGPLTDAIVPTIHRIEPANMTAGTDTSVVIFGSGLKNTTRQQEYTSRAVLTALDGSKVALTPAFVNEEAMGLVIDGNTAPGNYRLQAFKIDSLGAPVVSNPIGISIRPQVFIASANSPETTVTINGGGFAAYAAGSGTAVIGARKIGHRWVTEEATIVSWSDTTIVAVLQARPSQVTVHSIFGSVTSTVTKRTAKER